MSSLVRFVRNALIAVLFLAPSFAFALVPVGGKVAAIAPCITGGLVVSVVGFGLGSGVFLYFPGTVTYLYGPPIVGRWILGLSSVPTHCGIPLHVIGTSPAL